MSEIPYTVVQEPFHRYYRLDPIPGDKEISDFYRKRYYDLIRKGGRACELGRLMAGGEEAQKERVWLRETLYNDITAVLDRYGSGKKVLDVGCGAGEFVSYAQENGFDPTGIEPSEEAVQAAQAGGLPVSRCNLEEYALYGAGKEELFDAVVMLNVLEHVPHPAGTIEHAKRLLKPSGILCVRVPNDFTWIQQVALDKLGKKEWWVAVPDHINYFNFDSLHHFLGNLGFTVIYSQGDFPMEMFLLMGKDYVGNPEIGKECHKSRVSFETSLPGELRRRTYQALAEAGIGRDCLVFSKFKG